MSQALTLACDRARRNDFYWIIVKRQNTNAKVDRASTAYQNMMTNYYASNAYNED